MPIWRFEYSPVFRYAPFGDWFTSSWADKRPQEARVSGALCIPRPCTHPVWPSCQSTSQPYKARARCLRAQQLFVAVSERYVSKAAICVWTRCSLEGPAAMSRVSMTPEFVVAYLVSCSWNSFGNENCLYRIRDSCVELRLVLTLRAKARGASHNEVDIFRPSLNCFLVWSLPRTSFSSPTQKCRRSAPPSPEEAVLTPACHRERKASRASAPLLPRELVLLLRASRSESSRTSWARCGTSVRETALTRSSWRRLCSPPSRRKRSWAMDALSLRKAALFLMARIFWAPFLRR